MKTKLVLKKLSKERLTFSIPISFKILSFGITLILFIFIIFNNFYPSGKIVLSNLIPITLFLLSLLSTLYHEKWIFNNNNNVVIYQFGPIFLFKSKIIKLQNIKHLELKYFMKGGGGE